MQEDEIPEVQSSHSRTLLYLDELDAERRWLKVFAVEKSEKEVILVGESMIFLLEIW